MRLQLVEGHAGVVLAAVLDGNHLIAVRGDIAEECWRICEPVIDAWRAGTDPMDEYPAGSSGPTHWPGAERD